MNRVAWKRVFTVLLCAALCLTGCSRKAVPASQQTEKPDLASVAAPTPSLLPTQSPSATPAATSARTYPTTSPARKQTETGAVDFQDIGIEFAVRAALALPEGSITPDDMLLITELEIEGFTDDTRVRSLVDLAWVENLESLRINSSDLTSLHGIENLFKLKKLMIWSSGIQDITPLARLTNLEVLNLNHSKVIFIDVISELPNLRYLSLLGSPVRDISPVLGRTGFYYVSLSSETVDKDQYRRFLTEGMPYTIVEHKRLHPSLPVYRFEIIGNETELGSTRCITALRVYDTTSHKLVQEIPFAEEGETGPVLSGGYNGESYVFSDAFIFVDTDFDGYLDLRFLDFEEQGAYNFQYDFWSFDSTERQFVYNPRVSSLIEPVFDAEKQLIYSHEKDGCCWHMTETYKREGGKLIRIAVLVEDSRFFNYDYDIASQLSALAKAYSNKDMFRLKRVTLQELRDGEMVTVSDIFVLYLTDASGGEKREKVDEFPVDSPAGALVLSENEKR